MMNWILILVEFVFSIHNMHSKQTRHMSGTKPAAKLSMTIVSLVWALRCISSMYLPAAKLNEHGRKMARSNVQHDAQMEAAFMQLVYLLLIHITQNPPITGTVAVKNATGNPNT
jgi:hypothetical protein